MYLSKYFSTAANNSIVQVCPDPSSAKLKEITKRLFFFSVLCYYGSLVLGLLMGFSHWRHQ